MHLDDSTFEAKVLADSLNMSLPTLYRKIKQFSDCSILELTRTIRLKKAAELIQNAAVFGAGSRRNGRFQRHGHLRKRSRNNNGTTPRNTGQPVT